MAVEQLTFWDIPINQETHMMMQIIDLKEKQNNLRRGIFRRYDEMKKEIDELKEMIRNMEKK